MAWHTPLLDTGPIRRQLGWAPHTDEVSVVEELLDGMSNRQSAPTPPLAGGRRPGVTAQNRPGGQGE